MKRAFLLLAASVTLHAETGRAAWLRYAPLDRPAPEIPAVIVALDSSPPTLTARNEFVRGVRGMLGRTLRIETAVPQEPAFILRIDPSLSPQSFCLRNDKGSLVVTAADGRGLLYGSFALLRKIASGENLSNLNDAETPSAPIRWVNQWDNLNGTIERGYGGRSIFWDNGQAREDLTRVSEYGRLLASLGINGCSIANVNADPRLISPAFLPQIARIADAFRPWGVSTVISIDFGSPKAIGGLDTFDPLDERVAQWWRTKIDEIYRAVPDLGGIVMKADSEGRVGPSAYHRTHADAANVVARALKPHGGLLFYRGFVYDHHMDWRNPKNDRARAAYDNFHPLDGQFDDNVVIQIKNGPIDFQVREPVSPLFSALEKTNEALELQVTQEYMGQAKHAVFLVPQWKEVLDSLHHPLRAVVGVVNVGLDENWFGNELSQANLYGFGRLAWNPALTSQQIATDWTALTFGRDPKVLETVNSIQLTSWRTYENYTGPLGLQTLTDIVGNHYGVAVEASERNGWGQWHFADEHGAGMDRTVATGTGFIGQYPPQVASVFENSATCPDDLLLFFHHVPYTHKLHSGKTVLQSIYESHYEGAAAVEQYVRDWKTLKGRIDDQRYFEVLAQLEYQASQAEVWRDAVNDWFHKTSGIEDALGRAGHHPGRIEAESMKLDGYQPVAIKPWEAASGGSAISCPTARCTAIFSYDGPPAWRTLRIRYFDPNNGVSRFRLFVGEQLIDEWAADNHVPTIHLDGSSSSLHVASGIALRPGDTIRIEGTPGGNDPAALDYVEVQ